MDLCATHLPVLHLLGSKCSIRRVLELGCGLYSTLTFLDRTMFREVTRVVSIEHDLSWMKSISEKAGDDRLELRYVKNDELISHLSAVTMKDFDLIFIDNATETAKRVDTIRHIASIPVGSTIIVIHDYEVSEYQEASRGFQYRLVFSDLSPATAIFWNCEPETRGTFA